MFAPVKEHKVNKVVRRGPRTTNSKRCLPISDCAIKAVSLRPPRTLALCQQWADYKVKAVSKEALARLGQRVISWREAFFKVAEQRIVNWSVESDRSLITFCKKSSAMLHNVKCLWSCGIWKTLVSINHKSRIAIYSWLLTSSRNFINTLL